MATNFTRRQGEVWRTTIEMFDSNNCAILLASVGTNGPTNHQAFFQGTATKTVANGSTVNVDINFKLKPAETVEEGRGSNRITTYGYFKVEAYIPADSDAGTFDTATTYTIGDAVIFDDIKYIRINTDGTTATDPTQDTANWSLLGVVNTLDMEVGEWTYVIRYADASNPSSDENVRVIVDGTITIEELVADLGATPGTFTYTAPGE